MATGCKKIDLQNQTIPEKQQKQSKFSCNCISPQFFTLNLMLCTCALIIYYQHIIKNLNSSEKTYLNNIGYKNYKQCHLAILISGQIQRFIFKDQFGVLIENNNININTKIEWVIDVFIVLHNGTMSKPWGPNNIDPFGPHYMLNTTIQDIHKWYIQRGANNVVIKILNDTDMTRMINSSQTFLFKNTTNIISQSDIIELISNSQDRYHNRWFRYLRMFYLRHLVFTLTLDMNIKYAYDMLTYWRDDNYFLSPIDLNKLATYFQETQTAIAVDKYCGYGGLSDKIYVTNYEGAKLLFDVTFNDFKYKMVEWVQLAHKKVKQDGRYPFQTEAFLTTVIQKLKYVKIDLHRTELRYINGKLCTIPLYVQCTPELKQKHKQLICNRKQSHLRQKQKQSQIVINNNVNNINITEWNCSNVYVDLGSNIEVQIRKVFEPEKYLPNINFIPNWRNSLATTIKLFDEILGDIYTRRISTCVFGFEANPIHKNRLKQIEKCYQSKGWKTKFNVPKVVFDINNKTIPIYVNNQSRNEDWGASIVLNDHLEATNTVNVSTIDIGLWLQNLILLYEPKHILIKMDIEGAEFKVLPRMLELGILCKKYIDIIMFEAHPWAQHLMGSNFTTRQLLEQIKLQTQCEPTNIIFVDDETYLHDQQSLPRDC
eukprot:177040_1